MSHMKDALLSKHLLDLGFTQGEAQVYLALLTKGPCNAGPIITETGFHRNVVYTALAHLKARKLISERKVRGRAQFASTDPQHLAQEFSDKAATAQSVAKHLRDLAGTSGREITIHEGNEEYLALMCELIRSMPEGSTKYVIGTGGEAFMKETMIPLWKPYHQVARAQRLRIQMIGYQNQKPSIEAWTNSEKNYHIRYLPSVLENPSGIHVYPEIGVVVNILYSTVTQPVVAIKIQSEGLAQGYLNLFASLWRMTK